MICRDPHGGSERLGEEAPLSLEILGEDAKERTYHDL